MSLSISHQIEYSLLCLESLQSLHMLHNTLVFPGTAFPDLPLGGECRRRREAELHPSPGTFCTLGDTGWQRTVLGLLSRGTSRCPARQPSAATSGRPAGPWSS